MRSVLASITRTSVRFRWITIAITLSLIGAGIYSYTQLNQELLPDIEFPQTFVVAQNGGATSENILHMYSVPLEEQARDIDGVANVESTSRDGLAIIIVRNDFGLDQSRITGEIQDIANGIESDYIPVRRLETTDGNSADDLIGELEAEHLLWMQDYAASIGQGFKQQLSPDVWEQISTEALQGLPLTTFEQLGTGLENDLLARRGEENPDGIEFTYDAANPPVLPESWQASDPRFRTTADLVELATNRNVAAVLNDFHENGFLVGPLAYTSDLTPDDVRKVLAVEDNCRAFFNDAPPQTIGGRDRCSFVAYLVDDGSIANLTPEAYAVLPETIRNENPLDNPLEPNEDGVLPDTTPLPQAWRAEAISIVTFSFSDVPLGAISISSDTLSATDLRALIENDLIPTLRDRDDIADVVLVGGDEIAVQDIDTAIEEFESGQEESQPEVTDTEPVVVEVPESAPELDPTWQSAIGDEFERVDGEGTLDLSTAEGFLIPVINGFPDPDNNNEPFGNEIVGAETLNAIAAYGFTASYITDLLDAETLLWLGAQDEDFFANLSDTTINLLSSDVVAALPEDVQARRSDAPQLPSQWQAAAGFIPDIDQLATADDIFVVVEQREDGRQQAIADGATDVSDQPYTAAQFINEFAFDPSGQGQGLITALPASVWQYLAANEDGFWDNLAPVTLQSMSIEAISVVRDESGREFPDIVTLPDEPIARTNGNASFQLTIFKEADVNTVVGWNDTEAFLDEWAAENDVEINIAFEQASFIEESIQGVTNDGLLGGVMAIIVILVFMNLSIRSTLVTSISIPTSVMTALFLIIIIPGNVNDILTPLLDDVGRDSTLGSILEVVIRLFPANFTLNIMTLSGLTVAIGRVVDDSIVVLENIYRNVQQGDDQEAAVLNGTREVSVAILAATLTTMLVFLPLGLFGGVTGAFFLPFGLAVTYSLIGSYTVAITTVPALSSLLITKESMPKEGEDGFIVINDSMPAIEKNLNHTKNALIGVIGGLSRAYGQLISFLLKNTINRVAVVVAAIATLFFGLFLLANRPQTFLPDFGEPTISVSIQIDAIANGQRVTIDQTDAIVREIETYLLGGTYTNPITGETTTYEGKLDNGITTITSSVGGDAQQFDRNTDEVESTTGVLSIGMETQAELDALLPELRTFTEELMVNTFGETGAEFVTVSGVSLQGGGFGGFSIEIRGESDETTLAELRPYNDLVVETLEGVDNLVNVTSSASGLGGGDTTYIRIDGVPAIQFGGEIEDDDTFGVTQTALTEVEAAIEDFRSENPDLVPVSVGQGFDSEQQQEGFEQIFISMGIATLIVYFILALTFGNLIHPITILVSLPLSVVGAGVALTITGRVLGLSSLIGLLMLIGIVVTNAVVLLDRVQQNRREKSMSTYDALVEAGTIRLRPILMTAISTTFGVFPLALGLTEGAIIAAELGTVVIGGLASSTVLTLIVVPVVYSLFDDITRFFTGLFTGNRNTQQAATPAGD